MMFDDQYDRTQRPGTQYSGHVPTAQIGWELDELAKIYWDLRPKHVLEIGSQYGGTLYRWIEHAVKGAVIVAVDLGPDQWYPPVEFDQAVWQRWAREDVALHAIIGNSHDQETYEQIQAILPEIDFLFIDADHSYEGAKKDFEMYGIMVRPGGVIALHDLVTPLGKPHIQVWQLWREIQAAGYWTRELRANDDADYGGIGVVKI
jgi:cephalosporin hydroxylase